jgi:hypothetical protein
VIWREVCGHDDAFGVFPWPTTDTIARVYPRSPQ